MGEVKGATSQAMTHNLAPRRPFRWQDGHGAFSLRKRDAPILERYILSQKQHHSTNQAQAELEPSTTELEPSNLPVPSRL